MVDVSGGVMVTVRHDPLQASSLGFSLVLTASSNCVDPSSEISAAAIALTGRQFAEEGQKLIQRTLDLTRHARNEISKMDGIRVMGRQVLDGDSRHSVDETKVLVDISGLGVARDGGSDKKGLRSEIPKLDMLSAEQVLTPCDSDRCVR